MANKKTDGIAGPKKKNDVPLSASMLDREMGMALEAVMDLQGKLDDSFSMQESLED